MRKKSLMKYTAFLTALLLAIVMIFPLFWMVTGSLKTSMEIRKTPPVWLPESPQWSNYTLVLDKAPFLIYFKNSMILALSNTLMVLLISSFAGYIFARYQSKSLNILFYIIIGTMMLPKYLLYIPLFNAFVQLNLYDTLAGLILPGIVDAFGIFLIRQFILTVPDDLFEAAEIDGCNIFMTYRHVALPLCKPSLIALSIFVFINRWDILFWPMVITRSRELRTLSVGIAAFQGIYFQRLPLLMAATTLALLPVLIVFFVLQKYFIEGIALTGLKQ